jgi:enterochelin esterase-like enzyme
VTRIRLLACVVALAAISVTPAPVAAQPPAPAPQVTSPEIATDGRITFRLFAPSAQSVRLVTPGDIPGVARTPPTFTKSDAGVWEATVGPIDPGAYRYTFNVDGLATIDPRNPLTTESINNAWSFVYVPGSDTRDTKNIPHGGVTIVNYYSTALGRMRRMHVYTPASYDATTEKLPVFYLLHGAGDSDDAWTSVGRAGFILDNLIASGKAKPMVVVMPAGHTMRTPPAGGPIGRAASEEFVRDFLTDIVPYVEKHYRVLTDRAHTAIAGLSMGGGQTLNIGFQHLEKFGYIAVMSSGLIGAFPGLPGVNRGAPPPPAPPAGTGPPSAADWERAHAAALDNPALKKGLSMLWFSTGSDDGLLATTKATVELLQKHGFSPTFKESPGGHTWINWRNYLNEIAPQLFQTAAAAPRGTRSRADRP